MDSIALKPAQFALKSSNCSWAADNGLNLKYPSSISCLSPFFPQKMKLNGRNTTIVAASKKEDKSNEKRKKEDRHSFVARPDEATGPFPEAVLLKERKVQEDGRRLPEFADSEERELFEALNLELESDLDVERMRHYEVVYLIHEDFKDQVEKVNAKVEDFLKEKKGRIWRFSDWGMRRLVYRIQNAKNAHYILMNFEIEAKWINDFKTMLDKDERVIRHLVMKQDKAETEECPPPPDFHSLRSDMNDDADYDDDEYDDEEYDDEEWDDEGDEYEDDEGVIYVDEEEGEEEEEVSEKQVSGGFGRNKQETQKVGR